MTIVLALILGLSAHAADGTAMQGKKAQELYQAMINAKPADCKNRDCSAEMKNLTCIWTNQERIRSANCAYTDAQGKKRTVDGRHASRLTNAVLAAGVVETDCGAGKCGFSEPQDVGCLEKTKGKKKPSYSCTLAEHSDSCLSGKQQDQLDHLKDKYELARAKNPSCVSRRGAGACLSPREMLDMARLEREEEHGCRPAVHDSGFDHNAKPAMEAK
jgi:hypothetical protein